MNSANLQLEGLYLALAALHQTLVSKGLLSRDDIDIALHRAEQSALGDPRTMENLRPAERDALAFPTRLLRVALAHGEDDAGPPDFSSLARQVGLAKGPQNDEV